VRFQKISNYQPQGGLFKIPSRVPCPKPKFLKELSVNQNQTDLQREGRSNQNTSTGGLSIFS